VEDRTTNENASTIVRLRPPAILSVRYREAVWAWYAADLGPSDPALTARLDERIRRLEEAAATVRPPARSHFFQAARLIRNGDLTRAKSEYEAGTSTPLIDDTNAIAASAGAVTVEISVVPATVDVAVRGREPASASPPGLIDRITSRWRSDPRH
jgi:hypothetical protein